MVASGDADHRRLVARLLAGHYHPAVAIEIADVPDAVQALVTMHPALVVADLELDGHELGGLRPVLDAVSLGVAAVVIGAASISGALERRLRQLGIGCVKSGAPPEALFTAIDAALGLPSARRSAGPRSRVQTA